MRSGEILPRSSNDRFIQVRDDWRIACEGDHCAAALLREFEYWTHKTSNWSIEISISALRKGLLDLYAEDRIRAALEILIRCGFLVADRHQNGHPGRYRLQPEALARALRVEPVVLEDLPENREVPPEKSAGPSRKIGRSDTLHTARARSSDSSDKQTEESPLPPLSEVSYQALPKLLAQWAKDCSAKIPRYVVKELTSRDKRVQAQDTDEALDYRERLRAACAEYREDPSGLSLDDRLKAVRFSSGGSYRNGSGSGYSPPVKPVSAPEKRLRADLESRGCDFTGCGPTAEWVVNEVLGFQARHPELFNTKILPAAIVSAGGMGSTVITLCHAQIRERGGKGETVSEMIDRL